MATGLKTWDENGVLTFDTSTWLGRLFGSQVIPATPGNLTNADLSGAIGFSFPQFSYPTGADQRYTLCPWLRFQGVTISGSTLSWGAAPANSDGSAEIRPTTTIYYGGV